MHTNVFDRAGHNLVLTESGNVDYRYADENFSLGRDLRPTLQSCSIGSMSRIEVRVADVLPRWIVYQLLEPARRLWVRIQLVCRDDKTERLLSRLALNELDVVRTDVPAGPLVQVLAYNHLLSDCGITFLGSPKSGASHRCGFTNSLDQTLFILPLQGTTLGRSLAESCDA